MRLYFAPEDSLCREIGRKIFSGVLPGQHVEPLGKVTGNGDLRSSIKKFMNLVKQSHENKVFLITDLDNRPCAPALIGDWLKGHVLPANFYLRIAVREAESWVLADHKAMVDFFGSKLEGHLPVDPDSLPDPKKKLLSLVKKHGKREIRNTFVSEKDAASSQGIGYQEILSEYIGSYWDYDRAAGLSDSLMRAIRSVRNLGGGS